MALLAYMRGLLEETVSIGFNAKSVSINMDTLQLIEKLNSHGISLCVRDSELVCNSGKPIPKGIALTIGAHEKKLISYLAGNKADFRANEPEIHNLNKQSRFENEGVGDTDDLTSGEASALVQESCKNSQVSDQEQNCPTPLFNKGSPEKAGDKVHYRLPPTLLHNLMLWVAKYHELRLEHPNGVILNAQPHHVIEASAAYPWGVVYDPERYLLMSWGDVPKVTLLGLRDLETGELLIAEAVAA